MTKPDAYSSRIDAGRGVPCGTRIAKHHVQRELTSRFDRRTHTTPVLKPERKAGGFFFHLDGWLHPVGSVAAALTHALATDTRRYS
jgi:glycine/D-amino acid oxidase-like deaminating enzyme